MNRWIFACGVTLLLADSSVAEDVSFVVEPIVGPALVSPGFGASIGLADGNGDGILDLAVSAPDEQPTATIWVLWGPDFKAGPSVTAPSDIIPFDIFGLRIQFGDVTGDGLADLVVWDKDYQGTKNGRLWVYPGPTYTQRTLVPKPTAHANLGLGTSMTIADATNDGIADLVTGQPGTLNGEGGTVYVYPGPLGYTLPPAHVLVGPSGVVRPWGVLVGVDDYDGDGLTEVLTSEQLPVPTYPTHNVVKIDGLLAAAATPVLHSGPVQSWAEFSEVAFRDVNADGVRDIVYGSGRPIVVGSGIQNQDSSLTILLGPTYAQEIVVQSIPLSPSDSRFARALDVGDVNRDGILDIVVGATEYDTFPSSPFGEDGRATILFGPDFAQRQEIEPASPGGYVGLDIEVEDLNGDGFAELFVAAEGFAVVFLLRHETLRALDPPQVSATSGGKVRLSMECGRLSAGDSYVVLMSTSGDTPGVSFPYGSGTVDLPLNFDALTFLSLAYANTPMFWRFFGGLNADGNAAPAFDLAAGVAPPSAVGLTLTTAGLTLDGLGAPNYATNAVEISIDP